jgi:hypothetical protein
MNNHPYLRAYMAGISVPTPLLLVILSLFTIARFIYHLPIPIERVIIFPMAIVPNLFGVWNILHLATRSHTRLPLGIHGALLPFIIAPAGFLLGRGLGFLGATSRGLSCFGVGEIRYVYVAVVSAAVLIVYYLVWKYLIGFFNRVVGVAAY